MNIIRFILGRLILFLDWITSPKPFLISKEEKNRIDSITSNMVIYEFKACPFCVRVRRFMKKNNITIHTKDARKSPEYAEELINGGGKLQVPCLFIPSKDNEPKWLYESKDIVSFLTEELNFKR